MNDMRRMYAGQLRTPEQIEHRRAWKRQYGDNAKRIFVGHTYLGMESNFPVPREAVFAFAKSLIDEHRAQLREQFEQEKERELAEV